MSISKSEVNKVRRINWIKLFFFLSIILSFSFLIIKINNMFISVVLAIVLSQLLRPLVDMIEIKLGLKRFASTMLVFLFLGSITGLLIFLAFPFLGVQLQNLQNEIPNYIVRASELLSSLEEKSKNFLPFISEYNFINQIKEFLFNQLTEIVQGLPTALTNSFSVFFLSPFLAFFMVKDSYKITKGFLALVPNHVFTTVLSLTHQISHHISRFIQVRILEALIVGVITGVGLQLISFPFALLLGLFAGVMNLIPYLGPFIGFLPALMIALVNNQNLIGFAVLTGVYVVAQIIDNVILVPVLVARMMQIHPVTVLVLVTLGAQFLGILGMIISIPFAITIQVTYHAIYEHIIDIEATT